MGQLARSLLSIVLKSDPYSDFPYQDYPQDLQGWGSNDQIFAQILQAIAPAIVIEVGTWKGYSAFSMSEILKKQGKDFVIICVDTWLGGIEHIDDSMEINLNQYRKYGYPQLYYQFLANMMHLGCHESIVPFPNTSAIAARFLFKQKIQADVIYIDASHQEDDVYADLGNYWKILRSGGVMFGDDWNADALGYGVICAVNRFVREKELNLQVQGNKWIIQK